jgi:hypothetical protein
MILIILSDSCVRNNDSKAFLLFCFPLNVVDENEMPEIPFSLLDFPPTPHA